jgi:hypothetical protein
MAIFSNPDDFKTYKDYVPMLKSALAQVKPGPGKKFLFYAKYTFTDKKEKLPLVLVDFDLNCKTVLNTRSGKPTADGMVALNQAEELDFDATTGKLKRIRVKAFIGKMGAGFKPVFVPEGEVDDEAPLPGGDGEGKEPEITETQSQSAPTTVEPPTLPPRPTQPLPTTDPTSDRPLPKTPESTGPGKMDKQVEFAEKQFALRQRIEEIKGRTTPKELDELKRKALLMASGLVNAGKFVDASKLLDTLEQRLKATLPTRPPPPNTPPPTPQTQTSPPPKPKLPTLPPTPQEPKKVKPRPLSTFFNSSSNWKGAKKTSTESVQALQAAILNACDPELKKLVEPKVKSLTSIIDLMDEGIVIKVQEAANETNEDRLPQRLKAVADMANSQLNALRSHQLGPAADKNPFGNFSICGPMEAVLTKMTTDFAS